MPDNLPFEFVDDLVTYSICFHTEGIAATVNGSYHLAEMRKKYPEEWINWIIDRIGMIIDDS